MTPRSMTSLVLATLSMLAMVSTAAAGTPPPGFVETQVVTGGPTEGAIRPVAVAYEPGTGNLWVIEKGDGSAEGATRVRVRDAGTGEVTTALDLDARTAVGDLSFRHEWVGLAGPDSHWTHPSPFGSIIRPGDVSRQLQHPKQRDPHPVGTVVQLVDQLVHGLVQ